MKKSILLLLCVFLFVSDLLQSNSNIFTVKSDVTAQVENDFTNQLEPIPIGFRYSFPHGRQQEGVFGKPISDVGDSISIDVYLVERGRFIGPCANFDINLGSNSFSVIQTGNRCYNMSCSLVLPNGGDISGNSFNVSAGDGQNFNGNFTFTVVLQQQ